MHAICRDTDLWDNSPTVVLFCSFVELALLVVAESGPIGRSMMNYGVCSGRRVQVLLPSHTLQYK